MGWLKKFLDNLAKKISKHFKVNAWIAASSTGLAIPGRQNNKLKNQTDKKWLSRQ
ncbi:MAG TPA: hypothetical protein GXX38_09375 [Clostridia bacterium]|jgi:hypothetical protein|nr:hypothetical protein [Clostridia bacterium]